MLDVHPPHMAPHTWRDFFVHIATIVIGLLIAIGLEQAVETIHQHREARETHEALQREYEENRQRISRESILWKREIAALQNNLLVLRYPLGWLRGPDSQKLFPTFSLIFPHIFPHNASSLEGHRRISLIPKKWRNLLK
jgi:hypothetical protein